jgi:hypothetical protein
MASTGQGSSAPLEGAKHVSLRIFNVLQGLQNLCQFPGSIAGPIELEHISQP